MTCLLGQQSFLTHGSWDRLQTSGDPKLDQLGIEN